MNNNPNLATVLAVILSLLNYLLPQVEKTESVPAVAEQYTAQPEPEPALILPCKVVDVYDGDTLTVEVTITAKVRLLDCWAPELRDDGGKAARERMEELALDKSGMVIVPIQWKTIGQATSFDRILGRVWVEGKDVGAVMVREGHATAVR